MIGNHHHRMRALAAVVALAAHRATRTSAQAVDPTEHQAFADDLTAILHAENANDCTSALGVSMAFSLVWPGCVGEAIGQVRDVLGYPDDSSNMRLVWEETTQTMLASAGGQCLGGVWNGVCDSEAPLLKIANAIWYDDGSVLNSTYDSIVGGYAMQTDFEAMESPTVVNKWVENSTNGMIDSIVEEGKPLFPPYVLIAINSIYLKASWSEQFFEWLTNLDIFYDSASRTNTVSEAHFMNMVSYFDYSHDALPGHQVIDLPFDNSQMSMIFVLPLGDGSSEGAVRSAFWIPWNRPEWRCHSRSSSSNRPTMTSRALFPNLALSLHSRRDRELFVACLKIFPIVEISLSTMSSRRPSLTLTRRVLRQLQLQQ
jgi:hypothetical protein